MIIYGARNKVTGQWYVGQTRRTLKARINSHVARSKSPIATPFQKDLLEVGKDSFEWVILHESTETNLDEMEDKFISELNSLYPHGYNFKTNLVGCTDEFKRRTSEGVRRSLMERVC